MLKLLGNGGRVVGIDIDIRPHNRDSIEKHPLGDIVSLIQGSSIDEAVVYQAAQIARSAKSVMVVLDSNHTHEHVLRELELYAPLVTKGNYMVVYDTVVEFMEEDEIGDRPWSRGNNPLTAVRAFLENNQQFAIDESVDAKLLVSVGPSGYLKRIR
jgi:cephalosporin hydroxylase